MQKHKNEEWNENSFDSVTGFIRKIISPTTTPFPPPPPSSFPQQNDGSFDVHAEGIWPFGFDTNQVLSVHRWVCALAHAIR